MATRLKQIISVVALAGGATQIFAHSLNWGGRAVLPDFATPNDDDTNGDLEVVSATVATVTIKNNGGAAVTAFVLLESWHTIERAFGATATVVLSPQPFVPVRVGAGNGSATSQRYTSVAGGESDFSVTLAVPQLVDTYKVVGTCAGVALIVTIDCPDLVAGDRTLTQFRVITSAALVAGDQIDFVIS